MNDLAAAAGTHPSHGGVHGASKQDFSSLSTASSSLSRLHHQQQPHHQQQQHQPPPHQQHQQQQQQHHHDGSQQSLSALNSLNSLNSEQLSAMHQKLQNNLQTLQQQVTAGSSSGGGGGGGLAKSTTEQLNLMLQSCAKQQQKQHRDSSGGGGAVITGLLHQVRDPYHHQPSLGDGKPKCPECGKIYSNNSNLKQHIVNVHTVQTEYISCHVCNKQFKTKQYLQIHLLSMHGIRKRKSYPVYQSSHALAQQLQQAASAGQIHLSQQYASPEGWSDEKK